MSASESSSSGTNLQESIEQLIAETVRRSQADHDEETKQLKSALKQALTEVETGQAAMTRAAEILRSALETPGHLAVAPESAVAVVEESPEPSDEPVPTPIEEETTATVAEIGPHELDVVAHDVTFGIASSLQSWLKERPEVTNAKTREFVNGELRLELQMASGLNMPQLNEWIAEHKGRVSTSTASVLELRFRN